MPFEPVFEDINLNRRKGIIKEHIKVECKTEVPAVNVAKILNVTSRAVVTRSEVMDKEIYYEGKSTFFICYRTEEGEIEKCECGTEFKGSIKNSDVSSCRVQVTATVEKTEADVSGVRLAVSGYVGIEALVTECKRVNALSGGKELITDGKEISLLKSYGVRESVFPIEEEFEVDYVISDVLSQRAQAFVTAVQCGVGCIIVDGEVMLSAILLQSKEKNDIIRENKILPFRAEIECEDAMPSMSATAFVQEKSFKTDISVDKDNNKSTVRANVMLMLSGEALYGENVQVVQDAFSVAEELELEKEEFSFVRPCDLRSESKEITVTAVTDALPVGTTLVSCINEKAEILSESCGQNGLNVTGVITLTCFFKDNDGKIFSRRVESPFETTLNAMCQAECEYTVRAIAHKARVRLISETQLEISTEVFWTVYPYEKCNLSVIKGVKSLGEKNKQTHAISVYIPCEGEELWTLAKRLNVSPQELINTNQDLQFPLSGKERIVVYRQK